MTKRITIIATLFLCLAMSLPAQEKSTLDSTVRISANPDFRKGSIGQFFFGKHYRDTWTTPVLVPVFDVEEFKGGLEILKLGGGNQTKTLRLISEDKIQYNLRTIDKFPGLTLPESFRGTWVNNLLKDQISTAHPYSFLTVPHMSKALGLYYTNPSLFYVPANNQLGDYSKEYGDGLFMIEIRPDEDLSEFKRFGNTENAVGTDKMYEVLREDNDNKVDALFLAKARVFDMILGDWDRHEDQWRWAEFENEGKGVLYRAIPRDRDQTYAKMDGLVPSIVASRMFKRRIGHFGYDFDDIVGFNWSARDIDHNLLNELQLSDWLKVTHEIQEQLTDSVIDNAIAQIPSEVYSLSGPEIAEKLKSRRDKIHEAIETYYAFLSKEVRVAFSDKHELFEVYNEPDKTVRVVVHKVEKDGKKEDLLYERTFHPDTTRQIVLHGLGGIDRFKVYGERRFPIEVQMIGGLGLDSLISTDESASTFRNIKFYDRDGDFVETDSSKVPARGEYSIDVNDFQNKYYKYNVVTPRTSFDHSPDDGLFIGAGLYLEKNAYRENPKSSQLIKANWSTRTSGFNVSYEGRFNSLLVKDWDLEVLAWGHNRKFAFNYFGEGINTDFDQPIDYYRVGLEKAHISAHIVRKASPFFEVGVGPAYEYFNVTNNEGILADTNLSDAAELNSSSSFMGVSFFTRLDVTDHPRHPSMGIRWNNKINYWNDMAGDLVNLTQLQSNLSLYYTFNLPFRLTFATRFGVENNSGPYPFYQSRFLGGQSNLRGYRRSRFAGQGIFYQNTELRLSLAHLKNLFITGDVGLIGFIDHGKLWTSEGAEDGWKSSYGPGAFIALYDYFVFSAHYGFNKDEENIFTLKTGFLF